jgi:hypothetical protein
MTMQQNTWNTKNPTARKARKARLASAVTALSLGALALVGALGISNGGGHVSYTASGCVATPTTTCPADGGTGNG